ncbi:MAG: pyruvate formate lyase-activating protein [Leptolyngbyaceae cyanobacterium CSU_1_3]|nr:pyruvate formate lyase-activating protein [Leptolyngbyaceae cyanobacterium CSU_1_3]
MTHTLDRFSTTTGYIHSVETCGTVDGPGIRFIVFTAGCPLRCLYCANPDCRHLEDGKLVSVDELIDEIQKYTAYMQASGGGVTVCGGEPLFQPQFVREIFRRCKDLNLHTALDTSGFCDLSIAQPVIEFADLVLLDIKSFDPTTYHNVTGVSVEPTLALARYLSQIGKPVWIRFVLVPGLTDDPQNITRLAEFLATLTNIEKVDVLPFHKLGEYKWETLGYEYLLKDTPAPTPEQVNTALEIFRSHNLKAV